MNITNQLHQIKIIPEFISGSSTPIVLKRPQQTWKTLKRVQGLTNFRPYQNVGQSSKGHFNKCWVSTQPIKEVSLSPLREGAVPEGFCPGVPTGQVSGKTSRGFTLIEILIVVLIIGILAAVALPQYQRAVLKSRLARLKAMTQGVAIAQEVYYLNNGGYANTFNALDISTCESTSHACEDDTFICTIDNGNNAFVACWDKYAKIGYQSYYSYSKNSSSKKYCYARGADLTTLQHQVCKAETGATTTLGNDNVYRFWPYRL